MTRIRFPEEMDGMTVSDARGTEMEFYVRTEGKNILRFCYYYPAYNKEFVQKTWTIDKEIELIKTVTVSFFSNRSDLPRELRIETVRESIIPQLIEYHNIAEADLKVESSNFLKTRKIHEVTEDGDEAEFNADIEMIRNEINSRTFKSVFR